MAVNAPPPAPLRTGAARAAGAEGSVQPQAPESVAAVLHQAREMIQANERLDMARLSTEIGVDRTTLFRWVGNRDQLLVEVVWSVVEPLFARCTVTADGSGSAYIARVIGRWVAEAHRAPILRTVITRDPERSMRLLLGAGGGIHVRMVAAVEALLRQEADADCLPHQVALPELAKLIVRTMDSYVWTDLVTGDSPDPVGAQVAVGLLLRPRSAGRP